MRPTIRWMMFAGTRTRYECSDPVTTPQNGRMRFEDRVQAVDVRGLRQARVEQPSQLVHRRLLNRRKTNHKAGHY